MKKFMLTFTAEITAENIKDIPWRQLCGQFDVQLYDYSANSYLFRNSKCVVQEITKEKA